LGKAYTYLRLIAEMGDSSSRRVVKIVAMSAAVAGAVCAIRLWVQPKLLYFPRAYSDEKAYYSNMWSNAASRLGLSGSKILEIPYADPEAPAHARNCYLILSPSKAALNNKDPLWIVHGGNAMTAWDWLPSVLESARGQNSFLLVDYPGYGQNEPLRQRPASESAVLSNSLAAVDEAMKVIQKEKRTISETNLLGHSLGCGASMLLATALAERRTGTTATPPQPHPPVNKVLLSAPFLSVPYVAQSLMGPLPLLMYQALCSHKYDNQANVRRFLEISPSSQLTVIHGTRDEIIPVSHARTLAKENPKLRLLEADGAHHNDILSTHWQLYHSVLADAPGANL